MLTIRYWHSLKIDTLTVCFERHLRAFPMRFGGRRSEESVLFGDVCSKSDEVDIHVKGCSCEDSKQDGENPLLTEDGHCKIGWYTYYGAGLSTRLSILISVYKCLPMNWAYHR